MHLPPSIELPDRLGRWLWENRSNLPSMEVVEVVGNSAVLAFDLDEVSDFDEDFGPTETGRGFVYVEADGTSLYSELVDEDAKGAHPVASDFRTSLALQETRYSLLERRAHELERFRSSTIQFALLIGAGALIVLLGRL